MPRSVNPLTYIQIECKFCKKEFTSYRKNPKTYCSKKCATSDPEIKEKCRKAAEKTYMEKYGGHPMQKNQATKDKLKNSLKEKYGVEHYSQIGSEWKDKIKSTMKEKYGDENYNNPEQYKKTNLERYGVDNFRKSPLYIEKYKETCLKRYNTTHSSKSKEFKMEHKKLMFKKFMESERFNNFTPLFSIEEYEGVTTQFNRKYPFLCKRCNLKFEYFISDGRWIKCPTCDQNISEYQTEILEFIKSTLLNETVVSNDRTILYPKEIDIYIPSNKLAIECDSLYWHSEVSGSKNKTYHLNKTKACIMKEIKLIHIFENEWNNKSHIVKSIIRNLLNRTENKIYGRECDIREIEEDICGEFLNKNHIQGNSKASIKIGLFYNNELVSVMTFIKSRFNKNVEWEMARFCNRLNTSIVGGASKLFSYFTTKYNPNTIISYSDRRYFDGSIYNSLGFSFIENTQPSYFYILDHYTRLENRLTWMKNKLQDKLEGFDINLTEWENMKNHGYDRIWDCGVSKWIWKSNIP